MSSSGASAQLPLALRFPPDQRFETFAHAPAGALAQLRALAHGQGDSAFIAGPHASGKTHLLLACCAEAEAGGLRVAYLPLIAAVGRMRDALHACEQADLVALDGLEHAAGHREDEIALFDAHNRAHDAGRRVLYAARAMPDALSLTLPDLRSRLLALPSVEVSQPEDALIAAVLEKMFSDRQIRVGPGVIDFLVARIERSFATARKMVAVIDEAAMSARRNITVPFVRDVLRSHGIDV